MSHKSHKYYVCLPKILYILKFVSGYYINIFSTVLSVPHKIKTGLPKRPNTVDVLGKRSSRPQDEAFAAFCCGKTSNEGVLRRGNQFEVILELFIYKNRAKVRFNLIFALFYVCYKLTSIITVCVALSQSTVAPNASEMARRGTRVRLSTIIGGTSKIIGGSSSPTKVAKDVLVIS